MLITRQFNSIPVVMDMVKNRAILCNGPGFARIMEGYGHYEISTYRIFLESTQCMVANNYVYRANELIFLSQKGNATNIYFPVDDSPNDEEIMENMPIVVIDEDIIRLYYTFNFIKAIECSDENMEVRAIEVPQLYFDGTELKSRTIEATFVVEDYTWSDNLLKLIYYSYNGNKNEFLVPQIAMEPNYKLADQAKYMDCILTKDYIIRLLAGYPIGFLKRPYNLCDLQHFLPHFIFNDEDSYIRRVQEADYELIINTQDRYSPTIVTLPSKIVPSLIRSKENLGFYVKEQKDRLKKESPFYKNRGA